MRLRPRLRRRDATVPRQALAVAAALVVAGPLLPAGAGPTYGASDPVTVQVATLSPSIARPGETVRVAGQLTNTTGSNLRDVEVRLRLSQTRLNSRSEMAAVVEGRTTSRDGDVVASRELPDLGARASQPFNLSRQVADLAALTEFGVYALGVEVLASRNGGFGRVAILRTLLPWVPGQDDVLPTGFSWMWPIVSRPTRLADGTFSDDSLAVEMGPGGRLSRLVAAGARMAEGSGLTWAVDPELVAAAQDMTDGYQVRGADGVPVAGAGGTVAATWLESLTTATTGRQVLPLPWGDPDLVALERAGLEEHLVRAREQGAAALAGALPGAALLTDTAWPVHGFANRSTLDVLRADGVTTMVLDGGAMPSVIDLSYTPSGRSHIATASGRVEGVLAEPLLAELLRRPGPDPLLAAQRLLAETAMITSELPAAGASRTIMVMPPRRWDPPAAYLEGLTEAVPQAPWMERVTLPELARQQPPEVERETLRYPRSQRAGELPTPYLRALVDHSESIDVFSTILTEPGALLPQLNRGVLLLESSWWRDRAGRVNRLARERDHLADLRQSVRVQPGSFTFSSRRGTIPLTVANELDQDVIVVLRLDPQTIQLRLNDSAKQLRIGPQSKTQQQVGAVAVAGGNVLVDATLQTPDGTPYGQPVQVRISITEYGTVALYITVAAAAVLFVTAGFRILRRVRAARRSPPDNAATAT